MTLMVWDEVADVDPKIFDFKEQLALGEKYEDILDSHFSRWYDIEPAEREIQRLGVDRIFVANATSRRTSVEYKTDIRAEFTGNFFIEVVSVAPKSNFGQKKMGWAITSVAQMLVYYLPQTKMILSCSMQDLKDKVPSWSKQYPTGRAQNETYYGVGIKVPVSEIVELSNYRVKLEA